MRALALLAIVVGGSALAAPGVAPPAPADIEIDTSKLVLAQPRKTPPAKTQSICDLGDQSGCETACAANSPAGCARLGWTLALGGADNALLPSKKFDQDFPGAEAAFAKACKLGFHASCVDLQLVRKHANKPSNTAELSTSCKAGYGRACSMLADAAPNAKAKLALHEQACIGGDGEACIEVADAQANLNASLEWYRKAYATPTKGKVPLVCPAGAQAVRTVSAVTFAWTLYYPKWSCGTFDPQARRFVENGPFIELASEEDELVYPYGVISQRGSMVAGNRDGVIEHWNQRGDLVSVTSYKAGREHGLSIDLMRSRDGSVESITQVTYVEGRREGTYRDVTGDGEYTRRYEQGEYKSGQKTGTWLTVLVKSRKVVQVEHYVAGKVEGDSEEFDHKTGALVGRTTYIANKPTKDQRFTKGKLTRETRYVNGRRSEEKELGPDGKVTAISTFDADGDRTGRKIRDKRGNFVDDPDD